MVFTSSDAITLSDFIRAEQRKHEGASGHFSDILLSIALGTKIVARVINGAGIASLLGLTGETNVQGEAVQKLDVYADKVFSSVLGRTGQFISMVSEERETIFKAEDGDWRSDYVIAFDPLDGSSNIDVNVSIGTIWGIYKRVTDGSDVNPEDVSDFLQPGYSQVAAGYTIYGSSTAFVFTTGDGVHGFTLDPNIGEFVLTSRNMRIPPQGSTYSCNEGNYHTWSPGVKAYVDYVKNPKGEKPYRARYVGSLVADFHRTLLKGGIFLYPEDFKTKKGKLRLLYECAPLALIAEQAGGRASNGKEATLNLVPSSIHQRVAFFVGSTENVEHLEAYIRDLG
ncbi:MAG: class 1 fructose-bisphosphatase [Deltaproteobacteria bacterium]|nr:class 1 fructose-bisphosphatase [Deltaproteobacteria bacterium]